MAQLSKGTPDEVLRLPKMSDAETDALLSSCRICRMALNDWPQPYIIPLDYVYVGGTMYFHFADYGRKMDLYRRSPYVSVEVDLYDGDVTHYKSVTLMGKLQKVTDKGERDRVADALLASIGGSMENVAARHGFVSLDRGHLTSGGSLLLKLDVKDRIALKSPI
jgi:uncharacterized protein